ncbi:unnamed protein product [Chrysoparadoxa australica]
MNTLLSQDLGRPMAEVVQGLNPLDREKGMKDPKGAENETIPAAIAAGAASKKHKKKKKKKAKEAKKRLELETEPLLNTQAEGSTSAEDTVEQQQQAAWAPLAEGIGATSPKNEGGQPKELAPAADRSPTRTSKASPLMDLLGDGKMGESSHADLNSEVPPAEPNAYHGDSEDLEEEDLEAAVLDLLGDDDQDKPRKALPKPPARGKETPARRKDSFRREPSIWEPVMHGGVEEIKVELSRGAYIDEADEEGRTPLMMACVTGDLAAVDFLTREALPCADVEATAREGWTPLMLACGAGHVEVVRSLIAAGADLSAKDKAYGSTPLMWACGGGHFSVIKYLVEESANAPAMLLERNSSQWTPLMICCDGGHLEVVRFLVNRGARVDDFNADAETALDLAIESGTHAVEKYLRSINASRGSDWWNAAEEGDVEAMHNMLQKNPHLCSATDGNGRTALQLSCLAGHLDAVRLLLQEFGAEINSVDPDKSTALEVAVVTRNLPLVRYLVNVGRGDLSTKNKNGWSPLMQAAASSNLEMVRYLVDAGAEVNASNNDGQTVLDIAASSSSSKVQEYLVSKGAFSSADVKKQIDLVVGGGKRGVFRLW